MCTDATRMAPPSHTRSGRGHYGLPMSRMRVALVIAAVLSLTACGGPTPEPPRTPAGVDPTGAAVTGTYVFVEKDEQTLCDYLDTDGRRYHIIYGGQVGHGVLT